MRKGKTIMLAALALCLALSCAKSDAASGTAKPRELIIGAGSAYNPYWYLDENNKLTGFEKAVLDEIDSRLPGYAFSYQIFDFANILLALEGGKIDVAVHQYEYNIERAEKYLYGTVGYTTFPQFLAVREDDDSIRTFEDLKGKTLINTSTTNNSYYVANKWNTEHGNPFKMTFQPTVALVLEDIQAGRADAFLTMARNIDNYKKEYNAKIKAAGDEPLVNSNAYYLFNKQTGAELQKLFDEQLSSLKTDGTLVKLSIEWLGGDYIAKD